MSAELAGKTSAINNTINTIGVCYYCFIHRKNTKHRKIVEMPGERPEEIKPIDSY